MVIIVKKKKKKTLLIHFTDIECNVPKYLKCMICYKQFHQKKKKKKNYEITLI